jgi:hypothetical protein
MFALANAMQEKAAQRKNAAPAEFKEVTPESAASTLGVETVELEPTQSPIQPSTKNSQLWLAIRNAGGFIASKAGRWDLTLWGSGGIAVAGGLAAAYGGDYFVAKCCFLFAIAWLAVRSIADKEVKGQPSRAWIAALILLIATMIFGGSLLWIRHIENKHRDAKSAPPDIGQKAANDKSEAKQSCFENNGTLTDSTIGPCTINNDGPPIRNGTALGISPGSKVTGLHVNGIELNNTRPWPNLLRTVEKKQGDINAIRVAVYQFQKEFDDELNRKEGNVNAKAACKNAVSLAEKMILDHYLNEGNTLAYLQEYPPSCLGYPRKQPDPAQKSASQP